MWDRGQQDGGQQDGGQQEGARLEQEEADSGLGDFGEHLLPALVDRGKVFTFNIGGYWRDVGRPEAYLAAHRDLLPAGSTCSTTRSDRC